MSSRFADDFKSAAAPAMDYELGEDVVWKAAGGDVACRAVVTDRGVQVEPGMDARYGVQVIEVRVTHQAGLALDNRQTLEVRGQEFRVREVRDEQLRGYWALVLTRRVEIERGRVDARRQ